MTTAIAASDARAVEKDVNVLLRLSKAERNAWRAAAKAAGLTLSAYIRGRVNGERVVTTVVPQPPAPKRRRK